MRFIKLIMNGVIGPGYGPYYSIYHILFNDASCNILGVSGSNVVSQNYNQRPNIGDWFTPGGLPPYDSGTSGNAEVIIDISNYPTATTLQLQAWPNAGGASQVDIYTSVDNITYQKMGTIYFTAPAQWVTFNISGIYPGKIDLSGGTGGQSGQNVYTAPNGVVVTSSAYTYVSGNYYYMGYLFDGSYSPSNPASVCSYWLTNSSGNQTLTFDLNAIGNPAINQIRVWPRARDDASSNYRILVSDDNTNWTEVVPWVINDATINTPYGTTRIHDVSFKRRYIRFELTRNGSWGVLLQEIELWASKPVSLLIQDGEEIKTLLTGLETTSLVIPWNITCTRLSGDTSALGDGNPFGPSYLSGFKYAAGYIDNLASVTVDLGQICSNIEFITASLATDNHLLYNDAADVYISTDGNLWTKYGSIVNSIAPSGSTVATALSPSLVTARFIKITNFKLNSGIAQAVINEIGVYRDKAWYTLGLAPVTEAMFQDPRTMSDLLNVGADQWSELKTKQPAILSYTAEVAHLVCTMTADPNAKLVLPKEDINIAGLANRSFGLSTVSSTQGISGALVSVDRGKTWWGYQPNLLVQRSNKDLTDGLSHSAVTCGNYYSGYYPWYTIDDIWDTNNAQCFVSTSTVNNWLCYDMGAPYYINKFRYQADAWGNYAGGMRDFSIMASNDGINWVTQFTGSAVQSGAIQEFTWPVESAFRYWKLFISNAWNTSWLQIAEVEWICETQFSDGTWVQVDTTKLDQVEQYILSNNIFNQIPSSDWESLIKDSQWIRFAPYLSVESSGDTQEIGQITVTGDVAPHWQEGIHQQDYHYSYTAPNNLRIFLYSNGTFKINY